MFEIDGRPEQPEVTRGYRGRRRSEVIVRDEPGGNAPTEDPEEPPADGPSSGPAGESEETGKTSQDSPGGDSGSDGKQSPD